MKLSSNNFVKHLRLVGLGGLISVAALLILFPLKLQAQGCGELAEGQELRLDSPGGSMQNLRIQDQDGLGTCYANTASQVLYTSVSGLKEPPSYMHIATQYIQQNIIDSQIDNNVYKGLMEPIENSNKKESILSRGGHVCEAIAAARKAGGLCPQSSIAYEASLRNLKGEVRDLTNLQQSVVESISEYIDQVQAKIGLQTGVTSEGIKARVNKDSLKRVESDLQRLKEWALNEAEVECRLKAERGAIPNVERALSMAISRYLDKEPTCLVVDKVDQLMEPDMCRLARDFSGHSFITSDSGKENYQFIVRLPGSLSSAIERRLKPPKGPQPMKVIGKKIIPYYEPTPPVRNFSDFKSGIEASLVKYTKDLHGKDMAKGLSQLISYAGDELPKAYEQDYKTLFDGDFSDCKKSLALEVLAQPEKVKTYAASCNCENGDLLVSSSQVVSALGRGGIQNIDRIFDFLNKSGLGSLSSGLLGIIGSSCGAEDKVKIPEDLQCLKMHFDLDPEEATVGKPGFEKTRKELRSLTLQNLNSRKAFALNICTRFLKEPGFVYAQNAKDKRIDECRKTGANGLHAVTGMGMRCNKGKLQYMFLNSWGANWKPGEPYEGGNGRAWIDEDTLILNGLSMEYIK